MMGNSEAGHMPCTGLRASPLANGSLTLRSGESMSDGREEREEQEKRREQEERKNREDKIDRGYLDRADEWEPERVDS